MATPQTALSVRRAMPEDRDHIATALTGAFFDDPVVVWMIPDVDRRHQVLPTMFALFADAFLPHGEVRVTGDGIGAGLWLPPGVAAVSEDDAEEFGTATAAVMGDDAPRAFELMELMDAHHPADPSYYLQLVGVVPGWQGHGIGSALMAPVLAQCDRDQRPAYLEATSADNRRLYERHGFEVTGSFAPEGGPTLWSMWRTPR